MNCAMVGPYPADAYFAATTHPIHGGSAPHVELQEAQVFQTLPSDEMLAVDEALDLLAAKDPTAADLVKLKYFVGMSMEEAAAMLGLSLRNAERIWAYARAWLRRTIGGAPNGSGSGGNAAGRRTT